jgi:hypothetical protein
MKRRFYLGASTLGLAAGALLLTSCSTPQTRISDHPNLYQSLSARDQTLVSHGRICSGMSRNAVWLAWGSPDRKFLANAHGRVTETWIYISLMTYPYYPYGYPYNDLYDPFYYADVAPAIPYPSRVVTFLRGRVVAFQYQLPS